MALKGLYELQSKSGENNGTAHIADVQSLKIDGVYAENHSTLFSYGVPVVSRDRSGYFYDGHEHKEAYILHIEPDNLRWTNSTDKQIKDFTGMDKHDYERAIARGDANILYIPYENYNHAIEEHLIELFEEKMLEEKQSDTFDKECDDFDREFKKEDDEEKASDFDKDVDFDDR